ncbi:unnamed protein product [Brassicogethes aeneus]|uniref:C2H2-type domain-containing protein n=1 Tax=Brassicogethes aeneus TaxID=1431903 RepID=A0A9P0FHY3_BRAAE|nr:unnamed protein product [Brassicogethes aeneus]
MPKKEITKGRSYSRRAASKEALKQMHLILDDEAETLEIPDDDDEKVVPVDLPAPPPPKKKYKISHRKSSDGDREVLVFKSITNHNVENTLDLECWPEELSPEQLHRNTNMNFEEQEMAKHLENLIKNLNADIIYKGEYTTAVSVSEPIKGIKKNTAPIVLNNAAGATSYQLVMDPRMGLMGIMSPVASTSASITTTPAKLGKVQVAQNLGRQTSSRGRGRKPNQVGRPPAMQHVEKNSPAISAGRITRGIATPPQLAQDTSEGTCEVVGCIHSVYPFHSFPMEEPMRTKWIDACGNNNLHTANDLHLKKVCHKHFAEGYVNRYDRLIKNAWPSLCLPSAAQVKKNNQLIEDVTCLQQVANHKPSEGNVEGGLTTGTKNAEKKIVEWPGASTSDNREISFNKLQGKTYPSLVVVARPQLRANNVNADRGKLDTKVKSVLMHPPTKFTEWLIQQGLVKSEQRCAVHQSLLKLGMYSDVSKFPYSGGYVWISECCPQQFVSVFSGSLFEGSPHPPIVILKLLYHWACQTNVQNVTQWVKVNNLYVKGMFTYLRSVCTVALHTHVRRLGGPGIKVEVGVISLGTTSQDGAQRQVKVEVLGILETGSKLIRLRAVEPLADGDKNYRKRFLKILEPVLNWVHPTSTIVTDMTVDKVTLNNMGFHNIIQNTSSDSSVNNRAIMEYLRRIVPRMFQNTLSLLSRQIIQQFLDELVWREWFGTTTCCTFDNLILHLAEQTRGDTSLLVKLCRVSMNPFKNWAPVKQGAQGPPVPPLVLSGTPQQKGNDKPAKGKGRRTDTQMEPRPPKSSSPDIPEQLVPLENYYYGTIDHYVTSTKITLNIKCPQCKEVFTNNLQLMNHLFKHAHNVSMDAQLCRYCLTSVPTANDILKHFLNAHPCETKFDNGFVCLICETHYMNPFVLGKHMSKEHFPSELPYQCGSCSYRCSNHKQIIDHFYKAHDNGPTIQCPFCLKSTTVYSSSRNLAQNITFFIQHLQKHQKKQFAKRCGKCNLWFINKDDVKEHQQKMHCSQRGKTGLIGWSAPRNGVMVPKSKMEKYPGDADVINFGTLFFNVSKAARCKECDTPMNSPKHFPSFETCQNPNCQYSTCCTSAMQEHNARCSKKSELVPAPEPLPFDMFCVCGYSSGDGNVLAKHLAICERKSAYPSVQCAKQACVTHSMLDVLGLVRNPETATKRKKIKRSTPPIEKSAPIGVSDQDSSIIKEEKDVVESPSLKPDKTEQSASKVVEIEDSPPPQTVNSDSPKSEDDKLIEEKANEEGTEKPTDFEEIKDDSIDDVDLPKEDESSKNITEAMDEKSPEISEEKSSETEVSEEKSESEYITDATEVIEISEEKSSETEDAADVTEAIVEKGSEIEDVAEAVIKTCSEIEDASDAVEEKSNENVAKEMEEKPEEIGEAEEKSSETEEIDEAVVEKSEIEEEVASESTIKGTDFVGGSIKENIETTLDVKDDEKVSESTEPENISIAPVAAMEVEESESNETTLMETD